MADTFKTRTQLIAEALSDIGVIEPGEAPSAEDYAVADGKIDPLLAQLATDQIAYISDPEEIELQYFLPLASLLGNVCGPRFGSPINVEAKKADEQTLRRLTSTRPTYQAQIGEYF